MFVCFVFKLLSHHFVREIKFGILTAILKWYYFTLVLVDPLVYPWQVKSSLRTYDLSRNKLLQLFCTCLNKIALIVIRVRFLFDSKRSTCKLNVYLRCFLYFTNKIEFFYPNVGFIYWYFNMWLMRWRYQLHCWHFLYMQKSSDTYFPPSCVYLQVGYH